MDNKDMPAMPLMDDNGIPSTTGQIRDDDRATGFTKREELAARVLPEIYREYFVGLRKDEYAADSDWPQGIAQDALRVADAFFEMAEQDKENTKT